MKKFEIGDKCYLTENVKVLFGFPDGIEFTIKDILQEDFEYQIVLGAEEFGKDWVQFFRSEELIAID